MVALLRLFLAPFASPFKSKSRLEAETVHVPQPAVMRFPGTQRVRRPQDRTVALEGLDLARQLEMTSLAGPSCLGVFHLAAALGYGDQISNRVVDALGDLSGGVRLQD